MAVSPKGLLTAIRGSVILRLLTREKGFRDVVSGAFFFCGLHLRFLLLKKLSIEGVETFSEESPETGGILRLERDRKCLPGVDQFGR